MRSRFTLIAVIGLIALGSLALWTAIPAAWLWLSRDLRPDSTRYLVVIAGCAITMMVAAVFLYWLDGVHARLTGAASGAQRSGWLRSVSDERRPRRRLSLLERMLLVSALVALVAWVGWWAFLADSTDPSGPTAPGTEHGAWTGL